MKKFFKVIMAIVPFVALIFAMMSYYKTIDNEKEINRIETKYLDELTIKDSPNFKIINPFDSSTLRFHQDYTFNAEYRGELSNDYELWIIGRASGRYRIITNKRPLHLNKVKKELSFSGLSFSSHDDKAGEYELMLCYVTSIGRRFIDEVKYPYNFNEMPEGISILATRKIFLK